jgi:hypothetical protein
MRPHDYQIYVYFRAMDELGKRRGENLFKTTSLGRFLLNALVVYMPPCDIEAMDREIVMDNCIPPMDEVLSANTSSFRVQAMTAADKYELHKEEYIKNLQAWMDMEDKE